LRRALEQSLREVTRRGEGHLGAEHVLLGVLREERGAAAEALSGLGTSAAEVEDALFAELERRLAQRRSVRPGP
jgi:ATP-dependent Clp protease ATP-binding subunit ClpA